MHHLIFALALVACGTDPQPLDPAGTWHVTLTQGAGSCGLTGQSELERTLTLGAGGYTYAGYDADVIGNASIACTPDSCQLTFTEERSTDTSDSIFGGTWTLDPNDAITGSGSTGVAVSGASCSQAWSAIGSRR